MAARNKEIARRALERRAILLTRKGKNMRIVPICLALAASLGVVACGSSAPTSPSKASSLPVGAGSGSFGVFSQAMPADNAESAFARCLRGAGDGSCFSGAATRTNAIAFATGSTTATVPVSAGRVSALDAVLPGAPGNLLAYVFVFGESVNFYWDPPVGSGSEITNYLLQAGSSPGKSDIAAFLTGVSGHYPHFFTSVSGSGTFYVRVLAVTAAGNGPPSNEIVLTIGDRAVPGVPYGLSVSVQGSSVTLSWYAPYTGGAATTYIIQASSTRGGPPDLANFATGNTATTLTATGVAPGTYFVRVLAANNAGVGSPTSDVTLLIIGTSSCTAPPNQPTNLVAIVNGSTVTLGWSPSSGANATSYVVEAGSASGLADLANFDTGVSTATTQANGVGRGTYYVRVRGKNACGASSASAEVMVVVR